jgi:hypothetical protein
MATQEPPIVVKLDYHLARKTNARTYWKIAKNGNEYTLHDAAVARLIIILGTNKSVNKTHWNVYAIVLDTNIVFKRFRISNRGNLSISYHSILELKIPDEEARQIISFYQYELDPFAL